MFQKNPLLIFSRPVTYFGSPQDFEMEIEEIENGKDLLQLGLETDLLYPLQQRIGLFILWSDFE